MQIPVRITNKSSQASNFSIASWVDVWQRLNYLCIFAHTAPDEFIPERPLILRLTINKGGDTVAISRQKKSGQELNQSWSLELVLTPEEVLDFLPWIVSLVKSHDTSTASALEPPHPLNSNPSDVVLSQSLKTQRANNELSQKTLLDQNYLLLRGRYSV
jgi:hypothetical protein